MGWSSSLTAFWRKEYAVKVDLFEGSSNAGKADSWLYGIKRHQAREFKSAFCHPVTLWTQVKGVLRYAWWSRRCVRDLQHGAWYAGTSLSVCVCVVLWQNFCHRAESHQGVLPVKRGCSLSSWYWNLWTEIMFLIRKSVSKVLGRYVLVLTSGIMAEKEHSWPEIMLQFLW